VTHSRSGARRGKARLRGAGVVSAVLLGLVSVSACSTGFNPGAAATINGTTIPESQVDDVVSAACAYTAAVSTGGAPQPTSLANLRLSITQAMIQFALTDEVTRAMGLSVSPAAVSAASAQSSVPSGLSSDDAAALKGFFTDYATSTAQTQLIGGHLADSSVTSSDQVKGDNSRLAGKYLTTFAAKQDITVNPAYGRWNGAAVVGGGGSLSDAVTTSAKDSLVAATNAQANTSDLLPVQVC
jgi:hypothetical protein